MPFFAFQDYANKKKEGRNNPNEETVKALYTMIMRMAGKETPVKRTAGGTEEGA